MLKIKISEIMENTFVRVRTIKDVIIGSLSVISGLILLLLPTSSSINLLGFFLMCTGMILCIVMRSGYKHIRTGIKFSKAERYFSHAMLDEIKVKIASPQKLSSEDEDKGASLRLDVYYNKNVGTVYAQLHEYVPYTYEPCTNRYEYTYDIGCKLIER